MREKKEEIDVQEGPIVDQGLALSSSVLSEARLRAKADKMHRQYKALMDELCVEMPELAFFLRDVLITKALTTEMAKNSERFKKLAGLVKATESPEVKAYKELRKNDPASAIAAAKAQNAIAAAKAHRSFEESIFPADPSDVSPKQ